MGCLGALKFGPGRGLATWIQSTLLDGGRFGILKVAKGTGFERFRIERGDGPFEREGRKQVGLARMDRSRESSREV